MAELDGGQHMTEECLETVIMQGTLDIYQTSSDNGPTQPLGDPGEAGRSDAA